MPSRERRHSMPHKQDFGKGELSGPAYSCSFKKVKERPWYGTVKRIPSSAPTHLNTLLDIPSFGVVFLHPPEDAKVDAQSRGIEPEYDHVLTGTFEIVPQPNVKTLRYESIKLGVECTAILNMGLGRGIEVDELFRRELTFEEDQEGWPDKILDGSLNVGFSLILPCSLPIEDFHRDSRIHCTVYAIVEGVDAGNGSTSVRTSASLGDTSSQEDIPQQQKVLTTKFANLFMKGSGSLSRTPHKRQMPDACREASNGDSTPGLPSQGGDVTLTGQHVAERPIRMIHNPDHSGGTCVLEEQIGGSGAGLGTYDIALFSDIWTIASIMRLTVAITDISPLATIFNYRVFIRQAHTITSPRDGKVVRANYRIPIFEQGVEPPKGTEYPGKKVPALWRGTEAGGTDENVHFAQVVERVPSDRYLRPTTLPGIVTPMKVSHEMVIELCYSVYGEAVGGIQLAKPGSGQARVLRITRSLVVPSCWLMPDVLQLPKYEGEEKIPVQRQKPDPRDLWDACACCLTDSEVEARIKKAASEAYPEDGPSRAEQSRLKAQAEGRDWKIEIQRMGEE